MPCSPVLALADALDQPQVRHRGMRVSMPHPSGPLSLLASPMRFGDTPVRYELPPPLLGQHTAEVLQDVLGLSADEVQALQARQVV